VLVDAAMKNIGEISVYCD